MLHTNIKKIQYTWLVQDFELNWIPANCVHFVPALIAHENVFWKIAFGRGGIFLDGYFQKLTVSC